MVAGRADGHEFRAGLAARCRARVWAALGVSIGLSGFATRVASELNLVRIASADEGGTNIFDTDALTGLRQ